MANRKINFVEGEYYHIYNRGVDRRSIFNAEEDTARFFQSMMEFNVKEPIGSLYENSFLKEENQKPNPLVSFVAYCLNPNHFHLILTPLVEKGVESFMQRLGTGYTLYFNKKNKRSGSLFQGNFKASHIDSNEYLLHVSAYVNLNDKTHQLGGEASKLVCSSWDEYVSKNSNLANKICDKEIILKQFKNTTDYKDFALSSLQEIIRRKNTEGGLEGLLID